MPNTTIENSAVSQALPKDGMKRTQRVTIEFQQREVTFTVLGSAVDLDDRSPGDEVSNHPPVCPLCGGPWIAAVVRSGEELTATATAVHRALEQAGLHLQVSPTGDLQICRKSLEEIKEKL